jgi:hypothetical protein
MLTSKKVINAINEPIGYEFSASLQYYAIGAHFAAKALPQLHRDIQSGDEPGRRPKFPQAGPSHQLEYSDTIALRTTEILLPCAATVPRGLGNNRPFFSRRVEALPRCRIQSL